MTRWQIKREPLMLEKNDTISRAEAFAAISCDSVITGEENSKIVFKTICEFANRINSLPSVQPEITKEYDLKKIYNIYVKIAQAHFVYQPSKPKTIIAMPFDWMEVQNLLEKYLEDHGANFDALCREYVSENVKDNDLPSAQSERQTGKWIVDEKRFGDNEYHCNQCGAILEGDALIWRNNYYCYHCGTEMRGKQDE